MQPARFHRELRAETKELEPPFAFNIEAAHGRAGEGREKALKGVGKFLKPALDDLGPGVVRFCEDGDNAETGKEVWAQPAAVGARILASPALSNGSVVVQTINNQVLAFDAATGQKKWEFATDK